MSARLTFLYYGLWIAHPVLEATILAFMIGRGLQRQFKFFFGYIVTELVSFVLTVPFTYWHNYKVSA